MKKFIYLPDPHGEFVNRPAWDAAIAFAKDFKPDRRILGGDVFDFASFRAGASAAEQEESLESDLKAGLDLIMESRATDWAIGNHDSRPYTISKTGKTAALKDYARAVCDKIESAQKELGCQMVDYRVDRYLTLGPRLKAIHGFAGGKFSAAAQAAAFGSVVCGHTHRIDYHRCASIDVRECWVTGCLRDPFAPFNERNIATLSHAHGFAFGYYDETGSGYSVYQARKQEDGKWMINGKSY